MDSAATLNGGLPPKDSASKPSEPTTAEDTPALTIKVQESSGDLVIFYGRTAASDKALALYRQVLDSDPRAAAWPDMQTVSVYVSAPTILRLLKRQLLSNSIGRNL